MDSLATVVMPRFHCPLPLPELAPGALFDLPPGTARHVQVLRLQPGDGITLFTGGQAQGQWQAQITSMGRSQVQVRLGEHQALERELPRPVHLLVGITANERMDWLLEKATELGAASLTPLLAERSVLKLKGERGEKKRAHWQAIAAAACEQCGRNQIPQVHPSLTLAQWLAAQPVAEQGLGLRLVLSLAPGSRPLVQVLAQEVAASTAQQTQVPITLLSGPEGGLSAAEEALALSQGFMPVSLGNRILRAETAPLAALALLG